MNYPAKFIAAICVAVLLALLLPMHAMAASGLTIAPLRSELELQPGQAVTGTLSVRNSSNRAMGVKLGAEWFNVVDEEYNYGFTVSSELKNWVQFKQLEAMLQPGKSQVLEYTAGVPLGTEPGGKYIVIFASVKDRPTSIQRAGSLLYITVQGNISKRASVIEVELPLVTTTPQAHWELRIRSTGSAHFRSLVTTKVSNIFGQVLSTVTDEHLILPGTIRRLEGQAKLGGWPGVYKTHFLVGQGDDTAYTQTRWVFYTPIIPTILLAMAMIFLVRSLMKLIRKPGPKPIK